MSFVEFNNVTFGYKEDDYLLLEDLSFSAEKNDIITVIGASGCGKSRQRKPLCTPSASP